MKDSQIKVKDTLFVYVKKYKNLGIKKMLLIDKTHNYNNERFDENIAFKMLNQFVKFAVSSISKTKPFINDILSCLDKAVPKFLDIPHITIQDTCKPIPKNVREAILMSYINFVAWSQGVTLKVNSKKFKGARE